MTADAAASLRFHGLLPMRLCLLLLLVLGPSANIAAKAGALQVVAAEWTGEAGVRVRLGLDLRGEPLQALEQGVALPFQLQWRRCQPECGEPLGERRLELRHAPLLQRYLLQLDEQPPRQFPFRAALLTAFEQPPVLPLARAEGWQLRVRLCREELPAPLRLPALLEADWQLDSDWQAVP